MPRDCQQYMREALVLAKQAALLGEVPIGAVVVCDSHIIACAANSCESDKNPLQHAEIKALQVAARVKGGWRLNDCDLYVTLEPCPMCLGALFQARLRQDFIGCFDHKRMGGELSIFPSLKGLTELTDNNHTIRIEGGILEEECAQVLKDFFKEKRR